MVYIEPVGGPESGRCRVGVQARGRCFTSPEISTRQAKGLAAHLRKELDPWLAVIRLTQLRIYSVCNS